MPRYPTTPLSQAAPFPGPVVHKEAHLMWADVRRNHNKFFRIWLEESSDGQWRCRSHWGRVGAAGVQDVRAQGRDRYAAEDAYETLYREKVGKGYSEIDVIGSADAGFAPVAVAELGGSKISVVSPKKGVATASAPRIVRGADAYRMGIRAPDSWDRAAQDFYNEFLSEAVVLVDTGTQVRSISAAGVETPLGVLSDAQLARAQAVLDELAQAIVRRQVHEIDAKNSLFYTMIPTPVGRHLAAARMTTLTQVEEKQQMVRAMRDLLQMHQRAAEIEVATKGRKKKQKDGQDYPFQLIKPTAAEIAKIQELILVQKCDRHDVTSIRIREAWKVERPAEIARFRKDLGNLRLLFHGTRRTNVAGILSRGLLPSTFAVMAGASFTGRAFGDGIYLTPQICKSVGYVGNARPGERRPVFVVLAALGNSVEASEGEEFYRKYPRGLPTDKHSVYGKKGHRLIHDEFVVPTAEQTALAFLITV